MKNKFKKFLSILLLSSMLVGQLSLTTVAASNNNSLEQEIQNLDIEGYSELSGLGDTIKKELEKLLDKLNIPNMNDVIKKINEEIKKILPDMDDLVTDVIDKILNSEAIDKIVDQLLEKLNIEDLLNQLLAGIKDSIDKGVDKIIATIGQTITESIVGSVESIGKNVADTIKHTVDKFIEEGIDKIAENIGTITSDFLEGIVKGPIKGAIKGPIEAIIDSIKYGKVELASNSTENIKPSEKLTDFKENIDDANVQIKEVLAEVLVDDSYTDEDKAEATVAIAAITKVLDEYSEAIDQSITENKEDLDKIDKTYTELVNEAEKVDNSVIKGFARYSGFGRVETSIAAATGAYPEGVNNIIIASGDVYADALAANLLVSHYDAPIILVSGKTLPKAVEDYIDENELNSIIIVGGENTISKDIENELKSKTTNVRRISGKDRYDTAVQIIANNTGSLDGSVDKVILASGNVFADALSASAVTANEQIPILLTDKKGLDKGTIDFIDNAKVNEIYVVGGENTIPEDILKDLDVKHTRISGAGRVETSIAVAEVFFKDLDNVVIASGDDFPDALASGALSKINKAPIILNTGNKINPLIKSYISTNNIEGLVIVGGENSVPRELDI